MEELFFSNVMEEIDQNMEEKEEEDEESTQSSFIEANNDVFSETRRNFHQHLTSKDTYILYNAFNNLFSMLKYSNSEYYKANTGSRLIKWIQSLKFFTKSGDRRALGICFMNIGNIHLIEKRYTEAIEAYQSAIIQVNYEIGMYEEYQLPEIEIENQFIWEQKQIELEQLRLDRSFQYSKALKLYCLQEQNKQVWQEYVKYVKSLMEDHKQIGCSLPKKTLMLMECTIGYLKRDKIVQAQNSLQKAKDSILQIQQNQLNPFSPTISHSQMKKSQQTLTLDQLSSQSPFNQRNKGKFTNGNTFRSEWRYLDQTKSMKSTSYFKSIFDNFQKNSPSSQIIGGLTPKQRNLSMSFFPSHSKKQNYQTRSPSLYSHFQPAAKRSTLSKSRVRGDYLTLGSESQNQDIIFSSSNNGRNYQRPPSATTLSPINSQIKRKFTNLKSLHLERVPSSNSNEKQDKKNDKKKVSLILNDKTPQLKLDVTQTIPVLYGGDLKNEMENSQKSTQKPNFLEGNETDQIISLKYIEDKAINTIQETINGQIKQMEDENCSQIKIEALFDENLEKFQFEGKKQQDQSQSVLPQITQDQSFSDSQCNLNKRQLFLNLNDKDIDQRFVFSNPPHNLMNYSAIQETQSNNSNSESGMHTRFNKFFFFSKEELNNIQNREQYDYEMPIDSIKGILNIQEARLLIKNQQYLQACHILTESLENHKSYIQYYRDQTIRLIADTLKNFSIDDPKQKANILLSLCSTLNKNQYFDITVLIDACEKTLIQKSQSMIYNMMTDILTRKKDKISLSLITDFVENIVSPTTIDVFPLSSAESSLIQIERFARQYSKTYLPRPSLFLSILNSIKLIVQNIQEISFLKKEKDTPEIFSENLQYCRYIICIIQFNLWNDERLDEFLLKLLRQYSLHLIFLDLREVEDLDEFSLEKTINNIDSERECSIKIFKDQSLLFTYLFNMRQCQETFGIPLIVEKFQSSCYHQSF